MTNDLEKDKEVSELIKGILDIDKQLISPNRDKVIDLLQKAQNKFLKESITYEISYAINKNGSIVDINNIPTEVLLEKLPYYRQLYNSKLIDICKEEYSDLKTFRWIVELKDTHELIGTIDVASKTFIKFGSVELGYCYGEKFWHKGYATEALKRVIKFTPVGLKVEYI